MCGILQWRFLCYPAILHTCACMCMGAYIHFVLLAVSLQRLCALQIDFVATAPVAITIAIAFRLRQKYCNYAEQIAQLSPIQCCKNVCNNAPMRCTRMYVCVCLCLCMILKMLTPLHLSSYKTSERK